MRLFLSTFILSLILFSSTFSNDQIPSKQLATGDQYILPEQNLFANYIWETFYIFDLKPHYIGVQEISRAFSDEIYEVIDKENLERNNDEH